ncbi:MAG: NAD(P)H-dependent oxidoreductase [Methanolinea sp.]|nr:NAD(P)H-dependent oxidoreductase [Methanolinea sp.]
MKILYVYAHPEPKSLSGSLKDAAMVTLSSLRHDVKVSNLYAMQFKAVLDSHDFRIRARHDIFIPPLEQVHGVETRSLSPDIMDEIDRVAWADLLVIQFPLWWSSMPAILKGWFDRVFVQGFVVDIPAGKVFSQGLLRGKKAMLVVTTGSSQDKFSKEGGFGDLNGILSIISHNILEFCGIEVLPPFIVYGAPALSREEGAEVIRRYQDFLKGMLSR